MASSKWSLLVLPLIALGNKYDSSFEAFCHHYQPVLYAALEAIKNSIDASVHVQVHALEIALCVNSPPSADKGADEDDAPLEYLQLYLAHIYGLVAVVSSQLSLPLYSEISRAEISVVLYKPGASFASQLRLPCKIGPLTTLRDLARPATPWSQIISLDSPRGRRDRDEFLRIYDQQHGRDALESASLVVIDDVVPDKRNVPLTVLRNFRPLGRKSRSIAMGGTFDHLHAGHKLLLSVALVALQLCTLPDTKLQLRIGITTDTLLAKKEYSDLLQSWGERAAAVLQFMSGILKYGSSEAPSVTVDSSKHSLRFGNQLQIDCVKITDPFGPTITDPSIQTLVVSRETTKGAEAINNKRVEKGWEQLELVVVEVLDPKGQVDEGDFASKLSSTAIRKAIELERRSRAITAESTGEAETVDGQQMKSLRIL